MTSIIFPGQGSQSVGMAKDFNDNFKIAELSFEEIEDYTLIDIRKIIFENENNKLDLTKYSQICIFASSYAIFKTYVSEKNIKIEDINIMLGHSLGEYTALCCSNKINLKDCSLILKKRGELMHNAVAPNITGMAALIGKDSNYIQNIIEQNNLSLEIANDNSPMQIVLSGSKKELIKNKDLFINNNIKKFIELNVSAAFHSKYMKEAQEKLTKEINKLNFIENNIKIISNFNAEITSDNSHIISALKKQMANKVMWTKSIRKLDEKGVGKVIEIGPGKVLSSLIKRITNNIEIQSFSSVLDLKK